MTKPSLLSASLRSRVVRFCTMASPREACGLLAGTPGRALKVYPCRNVSEQPDRYEITPRAVYDASVDADRYGWVLIGGWHSHPRGPDRLSDADLSDAPELPDWVHVLVSLDTQPETVRAFVVDGGVPLEVLV